MNAPSLWHLKGTIDVQSSHTSYNLSALFYEIVPELKEEDIILLVHIIFMVMPMSHLLLNTFIFGTLISCEFFC